MGQIREVKYLQKLFFVVLVLCLLLGTGCAVHQGNTAIDDFGRYAQMRANETKKSDVYSNFGQPHDVRYQLNNSTWTYYNLKSSTSGATFIPFVGLVAGGMNSDITTADFFFNEDDVLTNFSTNKNRKFTNSFVGIVQGVSSFATDTQGDRVKVEMEKYGYAFDNSEALKAKDIGSVLGANPRD